ncbi:MAG TPA: hypothetical protein VF624_08775 [Tepidisphaeraceae bacterium]|jgi:hypothetical protein
MTTLSTHARIDEHGRLKIDLATSLKEGDVEIELRVRPVEKARGQDIEEILKFAGTMQWAGDPMEIQRELRREWPE